MPEPTATPVKHRMSWFVYAWAPGQPAVKMRHTSTMRGEWGWDVECSCGWSTKTGGATRTYIRDQVWSHKNGYSA